MKPGGRAGLLVGLALVWGTAMAGPLGLQALALPAAAAALLLLPGYLLDRILGGPSSHPLEIPARALTLSVAMIGLAGPLAVSWSLSIKAIVALMLAASVLLALLQPSLRPTSRPADKQSRLAVGAVVAVVAVALLAALMAAGGENIARDRMWYMAYLGALAERTPLDWSEPFFANGLVVPRFAHNAWLLSLASVKALAGASGPAVFQTMAPVLLAPLCASAAFFLSRAVFTSTPSACVATLTSMAVLLATRYPFFSPDRYPLFGRLAEDKTTALLIFAPVALAMAIERIKNGRRESPMAWAALGLALAAVALSHALVYMLVLVTLFAFAVWVVTWGKESLTAAARPLAAVVTIAILVGTVPAWLGFETRDDMALRTGVATTVSPTAPGPDSTHPVLRSHLRMKRLLALPAGGPVVNPRLLADPLLILSLLALALALAERRRLWAGFLLASSLPFLALAFLPWLAPAFGRLVLPWMAYRALWAIPFGLLLGALLLEAPARLAPFKGRTLGPTLLLALLVVGLAAGSTPWHRLSSVDREAGKLRPDTETLALLEEVAKLPPTAILAAASGLAELIPAYSQRSVLAFSDRGTVVFSRGRRQAQRRMEANAIIIGLAGGSRRLRNAAVGRYRVTHSVLEDQPCDRRSATLYDDGRFRLCAERSRPKTGIRPSRSTAAASTVGQGPLLASLGGRLLCRPQPERPAGSAMFRWRRGQRWSGRAVAVDCSVSFDTPQPAAFLRVVANLPRAREALVYRVAVTTENGTLLSRQGLIDFTGNPNATLRLPGHWLRRIDLRLVPAYLPYLNLKALEVRGR
ncbi:MAG: hypothetical protein VCA74_04085 [Deltaproteobacteria bacterium]